MKQTGRINLIESLVAMFQEGMNVDLWFTKKITELEELVELSRGWVPAYHDALEELKQAYLDFQMAAVRPDGTEDIYVNVPHQIINPGFISQMTQCFSGVAPAVELMHVRALVGVGNEDPDPEINEIVKNLIIMMAYAEAEFGIYEDHTYKIGNHDTYVDHNTRLELEEYIHARVLFNR